MISPGFIKIPKGISTWFLDTCVWSDVISSEKTRGKFVSFFQKNNILAGITQYSLLELTRVKSLIPKMDSLFFQMRHNIWIPLLYDELFDLELQNYPNNSDILFMAMSLITGEEENKYNKILEKLSTDPGVIQTRNEHLRFGDSNFMSLEKYKSNFPPSDGNNYSVKQADEFARQNGIDYFRRHNPDFLRQFKAPHETFLPEGLSSQYIRSLFIFYKFYLHGQSPNKSDFFDFAFVSYFPYFDVFVTERNVANVLKHIQVSLGIYKNNIVHNLPDFIRKFCS